MTARRDGFDPVLGIASLLAVAVGTVVGQGPIVSVLQGIGIGGTGFLVVLLISFGIAICNAITFAELSLMFPRAGGLSTYTEVAIGHFPAIIATFSGYVVVAMFGLSAKVLLVGIIISDLFPSMLSLIAIGVLVVAFFTVMNILGTGIFARIQNSLAFAMIASLLFIGLAACTKSGAPLPADHVPLADWGPVTGNLLGVITLGIRAFVGLEFVCPLIEESKNPRRDIPCSMFIGAVVQGRRRGQDLGIGRHRRARRAPGRRRGTVPGRPAIRATFRRSSPRTAPRPFSPASFQGSCVPVVRSGRPAPVSKPPPDPVQRQGHTPPGQSRAALSVQSEGRAPAPQESFPCG